MAKPLGRRNKVALPSLRFSSELPRVLHLDRTLEFSSPFTLIKGKRAGEGEMVLAIAIVSLFVLPQLALSAFAFRLKHRAAARRASATPSGHEPPVVKQTARGT